MKAVYKGAERREFTRLSYCMPLAFKVCKDKTISTLLQGYTSDVSQSGILCRLKEKVKKNDVLWLSFDRANLNICEELEKRSLIYQGGVIGKAVRIEPRKDGAYDVGIQFITREEKNPTHIYPMTYFLEKELNDEKK